VAVKFEAPMWRTFPDAINSPKTVSVSSIGVFPSGEWHW
jgi:hypothetical protein